MTNCSDLTLPGKWVIFDKNNKPFEKGHFKNNESFFSN